MAAAAVAAAVAALTIPAAVPNQHPRRLLLLNVRCGALRSVHCLLASAPPPSNQRQCKALYDYAGQPGDLNFKAGDVITILDDSVCLLG